MHLDLVGRYFDVTFNTRDGNLGPRANPEQPTTNAFTDHHPVLPDSPTPPCALVEQNVRRERWFVFGGFVYCSCCDGEVIEPRPITT